MSNSEKFYINGVWCDPIQAKSFEVIHPGNEEKIASIAMGSRADVNIAVDAAKEAFKTWQFSEVAERVALLERILKVYQSRAEEFVKIMPYEMGTTISFSRDWSSLGSCMVKLFSKSFNKFSKSPCITLKDIKSSSLSFLYKHQIKHRLFYLNQLDRSH